MTTQWSGPAWLVVLAGVVLVLLVAALAALLTGSRRSVRRLRLALAALERRTTLLEARRAEPGPTAGPTADAHLITRLGGGPVDDVAADEPALVPVLPPGQFADVLLREGVLHTASFVHGLRRALSPEVRARVRIEMRREVRRARRTRRVETRVALREWQARQRAGAPGAAAGAAGAAGAPARESAA